MLGSGDRSVGFRTKPTLDCSVVVVDAVGAVTVTVKAGSVILTFVIITDDPAAVKATVATALKDKTLASTALGVTVEEVPTVTVRLAPLPPLPPNERPLSRAASCRNIS